MKNYQKRAFSLIELSIVLLIIGILIAGVTQSSRLINQFRISSARSLTKSSPVNSMKGVTFWFDTVLEESFMSDLEDNSTVTVWKDINPTTSFKVDTNSDNGPTYVANCFKSLPCLKFDGVDDYLRLDKNIAFENYTIFMVVDPGNEGETGYMFSTIFGDAASQGLLEAVVASDSLQYQFGYAGNGAVLSMDPTNANLSGESFPYIFEVYENDTRAEILINGNAKGSNEAIDINGTRNTDGIVFSAYHGYGTPYNFMSGKISEVIFFNKALSESDRKEVRDYLTKKWK
jgi:prepilin-type N-terminal cleavage/methylation domain-containing protein